MKVILLLAVVTFVAGALANNEYLWGEIPDTDFHLSKVEVKKAAEPEKNISIIYRFSQKKVQNPRVISAIRVRNIEENSGTTAVLIHGGPGSMNATILVKSQSGQEISAEVEIFGSNCETPAVQLLF